MNTVKPVVCFTVVNCNNLPETHCCRYETEAAALAAISEMSVAANSRYLAAKFRTEVNRPCITDPYDLKALDNFEAANWHPLQINLTDTIYRLNTLPQESVQLVNEISLILKHFPKAYLSWTCTGHTRAQWQSASAVAFLNSHGFKATVTPSNDVEITLP